MKKSLTASALFFSPILLFAAEGGLEALIEKAGNIIGALVPIAITLALLFFIWGLAVYIKDSGNAEKNVEGKNRMLQGILALFVIVSIWGIIRFISTTIGIGQDTDINIPQVPGVSGANNQGESQAYISCYGGCMATGGTDGICDAQCR